MANLDVLNPFTSEVISKLELESKEEALKKLEEAFKLHKDHPEGLSKEKRIRILEKFHEVLKANQEELIQTSISEGGKPYMDTVVEMDRALNGVKLGIQSVLNIKGEMIPMDLNGASADKLAYTQKNPIGVVFSISAFNHPINLAIHQIVPCVAAGCPVIYKPALTTPLVSKKIIDLLHEAGLPKEWCTYLLCDNETTAEIAKSEKLGYISFIGSSKVGWDIKKNMASGVKIALEHGGNAPVIVAEDADLSKAVLQLIKAGFYHAGQVCVSAQRIYVHESILETFIETFKAKSIKLILSNPQDKECEVGPIINAEALDRIDNWVKVAIKEGAQLVCGGNKIDNHSYQPTILLNPDENSLVTKEEIFGPVICIYSYSEINNAISRANQSPYIFQSAAYTENINLAFKLSKELNGAAVMINSHPAFRVDWMPFGGQGLSGEGLGGIDYSVNEILKQKLIVIQH